MQIRVYYEDTDTGGVVYHANYLNFCERARSELFFQENLSPKFENGHFVAVSIEAKYIKSAKLGDMLEVKTKRVNIKSASFTVLHEVFLEEVKLFEMTIRLGYIGYDNKPRVIEKSVKELLMRLFT